MPAAARYTIARKLATGGMAEIFLATQHGPRGFEKPVVLKRILAALYADPQFRDMLIDEARIHVGLAHSNIAQLLDLGSSGGRYFLVFELVDGWDLGRLMERARQVEVPVPPELALFIVGESLRGLSYAHTKTRDGKPLGIVHRDVSPQNVLVSEHGEVKIADFGIAKAMSRQERTGSGVVKGKIAYMSPEQASGKTLDARSDLFSVGTMLYQMTTGRRPFDASTDLEVLYRVQNGTFDRPEMVHPSIEPELASVINRAMRPAPEDRFQSAEEMLVAVERLLRSVFQPAGQTELKQWLHGLASIDGGQPISRAPVSGQEPTTAKELRAGNTLVLDGNASAKRRRITDLIESAPTITLRTAPGPTREDLQFAPSEDAPPETRLQAESRRHGKLWAVILGVLALAGGLAFWRVVQREGREAIQESVSADAGAKSAQTPSALNAPPASAPATDATTSAVAAEETPPSDIEPEPTPPTPTPPQPTVVPALAPTPPPMVVSGPEQAPVGATAPARPPGTQAKIAPDTAPPPPWQQQPQIEHPWRSPSTLPGAVIPPPVTAPAPPTSGGAKDPPATTAPVGPPAAPVQPAQPAPTPATPPAAATPAPAPPPSDPANPPSPAPAPPAPSPSSDRG